jgi:hypothetical protein
MPEAVASITAPTGGASSGKFLPSTNRRAFFTAAGAAAAALAVPALASPFAESEMIRLFRAWAVLVKEPEQYQDIRFDRLMRAALKANVTDTRDEAALGWMIALSMFGGRTVDSGTMMPAHVFTPLHSYIFNMAARYPELAAIARGAAA